MKILNVIPYWGTEYGGPVLNVLNISANLILAGHKSTVITTSKTKASFNGDYSYKIGERNIAIPLYICKRFENYFFFSIEFITKFVKLARKQDCVLIHGFWRFPNTFAAIICRFYKIPYCIFTHAMFSPWSLSQKKIGKYIYFNFIEKINLNKASLIFIFEKDELEELRKKNIKTRIAFFNSALNKKDVLESYRKKQERRESVMDGNTTILYLSRIHLKKNLLLLVKAINELVQIEPRVRLLIVGPIEDAFYFKKVESFIREHRLKSYISYKGVAEREEKDKFFFESDIFVLPSEDEAFPLAILEAMSYGLPVIVTPGCKMPEIDQKMGYVVEKNPDAIAKAILRLIKNKKSAKSFGASGYEYVLNNFTWDMKIFELIEILKSSV